jgi:antitoxin component YwqK of YwqJK toxin-antitoxin module
LKKNILLSVLICLLFSCGKKKTIIENELDTIGINKEHYNVIDTFFYESKKIKTLRFYKEKSDYIMVGFYESGKKKSIANIKNNNQIYDTMIDWYENGRPKWVRKYDNNGVQIGKNINFRENGSLEHEYDNDKEESTNYWPNGKPKFKFVENVSQSYHYLNGNFMEKYTQKTQKKGEYNVEYFNENGDLVFSGLYRKRILFKDNLRYNGKIICYFNNGKISLFQNVVNGIPDGKFYAYYGNGNLKYESEVENAEEIYYKGYYENGKVNIIRDGIKNTFTQWDEKGKLIEQEPL